MHNQTEKQVKKKLSTFKIVHRESLTADRQPYMGLLCSSGAGRFSPSAASINPGCKHVGELHFLGLRPAALHFLVSSQNHSHGVRASGGAPT